MIKLACSYLLLWTRDGLKSDKSSKERAKVKRQHSVSIVRIAEQDTYGVHEAARAKEPILASTGRNA